MLGKLEYYWSKLLKKIRLKALVNVKIGKGSKICSGSQLVNVSLGKYTDIGYDCIIVNTQIGSFCSVGANVIIGGASHTIDWVSTSTVFNENRDHLPTKFSKHKFSLESNTKLGNDIWIGNNVLIKANLKVGDGAVIGMGSVVTKDIGPYEIWAGNPAKLIRKRFDDETIDKLLKSEWWSWNDEKIREYSSSINNVKEFLSKIEKG
ncbi:CatB-related O-acetyltransferase [Sphingobacterium lactis]|uniref:CatB-related O-acetyltransferase n=1 Tax=Sphingobacterium lactis TaxID=797291 RepID=UPI003F7FB8FF